MKCKEWNEGFAWEYLWNNWYKWDKWQISVHAASLSLYPIIQSNTPVESHWNSLKNISLLRFNRIRIDHLCFEIHRSFLPAIQQTVHQYRTGIEAASWHDGMVTEWKRLQRTIANEDEVDLSEAEVAHIEPNVEDSPSSFRLQRMKDQHHTDVAT